MSCNCEGITCPCGIPCSCPSSPCGCTDCKNSAKHVNVCQLCWQQIDPSSKENMCRCFTGDSAEPESGVSQQRSAADSSTVHQLEINSGARVEGDSGAGVRTASTTNVMTDPGFQMEGVSGIRVWQNFCSQITAGTKVKEVSTDIVRKDSSVQVSGVDSGSQAKGVSGMKVREDYNARVPTDSSAKVMEVSSNKAREDCGIQVPEVSVAQVREDSSVQVGSALHESSTSPSHGICSACGSSCLVPVVNFPYLCLECSGVRFVTPVFPFIQSSINPTGINYASNLMPNASVSLPYENLAQQTGAHGLELNQQFLEQRNQTSPEDKDSFIKDWLKNTKIHPYRKDPI